MNPVVTLTDAPDREAEHAIESGLARYNAEQAGIADSRPLAVLVSDSATDDVVGGLLGRTSLGVLFVDLFFLPDALRGHRLGSRILQVAEDGARRRGCEAAVLYTISFQPPGTSRIFLSKALGAGLVDTRPAGS